jgi:hypothetical protein
MLRLMFLRMLLYVAAVLVAGSATLSAQATEDVEGCKDSKLLSRLPGCFIMICEAKEFDQAVINRPA